jgi:hypothetical protein
MKLSLRTAGSLLVALATGCSFATTPAEFGLGGTPACETVPCGTSAASTMKVCTATTSVGTCSGITYEVGSKKYSCGSCTDCEQAATQAAQACEGIGGGTNTNTGLDAGGGTTVPDSGTTVPDSGSHDSGTGGGSGMTCSAQVPCGTNGLTYDECTTVQNGACSQITYETSDGQSYSCNGCSDCTSAVTQLEGYCNGNSTGTDAGTGTGGTTCSSSVSCGTSGTTYEVCTTTDGSGACSQIAYQTSDGQSFDCSGCSDCTSAGEQLTSWCAGSSSGGQQCGSVTCGSTAACCTCSGQPICYSLPPGSTCADIGAGCS